MDGKYIKSRILSILSSKNYRPSTVHEIELRLNVPAKSRVKFFAIIDRMQHSGEITVTKGGKLMSSRTGGSENATLLSVGVRGAFARLEEKNSDVFINLDNLNGAMPGDTVKVKVLRPDDERPAGVVMSVEKRGFVEFTGIFHRIGKQAYVSPDAKYKGKIKADAKSARLLNEGDMVFCKMKEYAHKGAEALCTVTESYGSSSSARACCEAILDRFHARKAFPPQVIEAAKSVPRKVEKGEGRTDLRDLPIFTIDGATSKDLDDAVSVEKLDGGYRLGVHIADVSHYVTGRSPLDEEAFERGTSIYFGNTVIPMLPKELSNGICSLNPNEDRFAFSMFMEINASGKITGSRLEKSVIRSRVKGVYDEVNRIFDGDADAELEKKYREVLPELAVMRRLAVLLREARFARGAFDFETDESVLEIDGEGVAVGVTKRERGEAEKLIEEFMLAANEAVATLAFNRKMPFVYRVHEEPELSKLEDLAAAMSASGFDARSIRPGLEPADIKLVLGKIEGSPKEKALSSIVLRCMSKARYSPDCIGHFGLALKYYCHFTSPIRRYPDLAIHRILTDMLSGASGEELDGRYKAFAADASLNSSAREVSAMQIEWSCEDAYKAEYMTSHIGEQFDGTVSSVKSFGMYVMLENTVEGLVRIENLPGWYDYDEKSLTLKNSSSGKTFSIGDPVRVVLAGADVPTGRIDFTLI